MRSSLNNSGGNDDSIVTVDLSDLWGIILKQRRVILGFIGIVFGLALTANFLATPIYKATSVVRLAIKAGQEVKSDKVVDIDQSFMSKFMSK